MGILLKLKAAKQGAASSKKRKLCERIVEEQAARHQAAVRDIASRHQAARAGAFKRLRANHAALLAETETLQQVGGGRVYHEARRKALQHVCSCYIFFMSECMHVCCSDCRLANSVRRSCCTGAAARLALHWQVCRSLLPAT